MEGDKELNEEDETENVEKTELVSEAVESSVGLLEPETNVMVGRLVKVSQKVWEAVIHELKELAGVIKPEKVAKGEAEKKAVAAELNVFVFTPE